MKYLMKNTASLDSVNTGYFPGPSKARAAYPSLMEARKGGSGRQRILMGRSVSNGLGETLDEAAVAEERRCPSKEQLAYPSQGVM